MSAKQLRNFSQVRDHFVRESAAAVASKTVNLELGVLRKCPGLRTSIAVAAEELHYAGAPILTFRTHPWPPTLTTGGRIAYKGDGRCVRGARWGRSRSFATNVSITN